jgi:protein SCO1
MVLLFWFSGFFYITNGFSNLTLESERKAMLFATQPQLSMGLVDETGHITNLAEITKQHNKILITQFIYTQCKTLCLTLGDYFQQAQAQIKVQNLNQKLHLLSISFDVANDSPGRLTNYRNRMRADANTWSLATMQTANDVMRAKAQLGLIVLPTKDKEFVHNSAFLVISRTGKLLGIYNEDDLQGALMLAVAHRDKI